jgi:hypothetical protein
LAKEDPFVTTAEALARDVLKAPLSVQRGACLFYEISVDNKLNLQADPKVPLRGQGAFQTDLCVFEQVSPDVALPRVVLEFKKGVTTHDVLTYSAKARRHKQVYPYLRYGMILSSLKAVPGRVFKHNESLDFVAALGELSDAKVRATLSALFTSEITASRLLEKIAFEATCPRVYRNAPIAE